MPKQILSPEQVDYVEEMMNIGAGNAATALEQLLKNRFEMCLPAIHVVPPHAAFSVIGDPAEAVTGVRMKMLGACKGELFFVVPQRLQQKLGNLAYAAVGLGAKSADDTSVIVEIANILAGVYLTAIHDFCGLNIYHSVPFAATDMAQALLDETIATISDQNELFIIIVNKFQAPDSKETINTYFILVPEVNSLLVLSNSIEEAKKLTRG